jgi:hypothetical protein
VFLKYESGWFSYLKLDFPMAISRFTEVIKDCLCFGDEDQEVISTEHIVRIGGPAIGSPTKVLKTTESKDDFVYLPHRACLTI